MSGFIAYIKKASYEDFIRSAVLLCFLSSFFGHSFLTMDRASAELPYLLRGLVAFLFYAAKYFTIPLTIIAILQFMFNKKSRYVFLKQLSSLWILWGFIVFMSIQLYFAPDTDITESRLEVFYTQVLPVAIAALLFNTPQKILSIRNSFFVVGFLLVLMFIFSGGQGLFKPIMPGLATNRMERLVLRSDTISTASRCYIIALAGLCILATNHFNRIIQWSIIIGTFLLMFIALATGSKGPFVSFMVAAAVLIYLINITRTKKIEILVVMLLATTIILVYVSNIWPESPRHLLESDEIRGSMFAAVLQSVPTLFGEGIGSFYNYFWDLGEYAHNIFLESYFETGIAGLIFLLILIASHFIKLLSVYKNNREPAILFCIVGFTYYLTSSQFSGYLLGNAGLLMFFLLGTWLIIYQTIRKKFQILAR